jgi:uncharacterized phage protein (TIGR02218 family)
VLFRSDWSNVDDRALLDVATIGEARRGERAFSAELRSSAHYFDQPQGRAFQRGCAADLGDARCGVDLTAPQFHTTGVVASHAGGVLEADCAKAFDAGFLTGGFLTFTSGADIGARFVIKSHLQQGARATIALWTAPARAAAAGDAILVTAGCDKSPARCAARFGNIVNFRGFPHMPGNDRVIAHPGGDSGPMDGGSLFR